MTKECEIYLRHVVFYMFLFHSFLPVFGFSAFSENDFHFVPPSCDHFSPQSFRHLSQNQAIKSRYQFFKVCGIIGAVSRYFTRKKVF